MASGLKPRAATACARPTASIPCRWRQTCWPRILSQTGPIGSVGRHYLHCDEGWLYLAVILDLFTRKVVGWAMRDHMRAELTIAALTMAIQRRRPPAGLIHHSHRGTQHAARAWGVIFAAASTTQSMRPAGTAGCTTPLATLSPPLT